MRGSGQALLGVLAAVVSALIVFGSLAISMAEGRVPIAFLPSETPTSTQPIPTQKPGEPTFTPSPTPLATATPTMITPSGVCKSPPGWMQVTVEYGDNWASLALRYATTPDALIAGNCTDGLMPGTVIWVPPLPPTATQTDTPLPSATIFYPPKPTKPLICSKPVGWVDYYVRHGDTLSRIGAAFGISYRELMARNCLDSTLIRVGQRLWVPYVPPTPFFSPTAPAPVFTNTPVPPTSTQIPPTATPVTPPTNTNPVPISTNTPIPSNTPTSTPVTPPTSTNPVPISTNTSVPSNTPSPT